MVTCASAVLIGQALSAGTVRYEVVAQDEYTYQSVATEFYVIEAEEDDVVEDSVLVRIDGDYLMYYGELVNGLPVFESESFPVEKVSNITPGDTWTSYLGDWPMYEVAVGEVQKTVPAGTFAAMEIDMWDDLNRSVYVGKRWLAEGVGLLGFEGELLGVTSFQRLTAYTYVGGSGYWPMAVGNELIYETGDSVSVVNAPHATITVDGDPSDWTLFEPAVEDPEGDDPSDFSGVDIKELYVANDDSKLYVMCSFWDGGPSVEWGGSRTGAYQVYVMPDGDDFPEIALISFYEDSFWSLTSINFTFEGTQTACGEVLECSIPLVNLGNPSSLYRFSLSVGDMDENYDKSNTVGVNFATDDCCVGLTGNVDNDPLNVCDIGDLTALIDYLFITFTVPNCVNEANCDGSTNGVVDIGDLSALIDYLFITLTPLAPCL